MLGRLLLYGAAGWCIEVLFTGLWALLIERNRAATAHTYLWMFPIYSMGGLLLEVASDLTDGLALGLRALVYVAIIYGVEASTGILLKKLIGKCPWDYTGRGWNVKGLIRLDYAPAWYALALLFDPVRHAVTF
jgi:uncharacterized membrane protein